MGKLFTSLDQTLHRMIGAPPPALPPLPPGHVNSLHTEYDSESIMSSKVGNNQSAMSMSALVSSASVETISGWTGDSRKTIPGRSVSEPDFGRSPKQVLLSLSSVCFGSYRHEIIVLMDNFWDIVLPFFGLSCFFCCFNTFWRAEREREVFLLMEGQHL